MTKKEMQEKLDKRTRKAKEQNEEAKKYWYNATCRISKEVKARIDALGLSVNGAINDALPPYLELVEQLQQEQDEPRTVYNISVMRADTATTHQNAPERTKTTAADKIPTSDQKTENQGTGNAESANIGIFAHKKTQEEINAELEAAQAEINAKRAEQDAERARQEAEAEEARRQESENFKDGLRKRRAAAKEAEGAAQEEPEKEYKPPVYRDQYGRVIDDPVKWSEEQQRKTKMEYYKNSYNPAHKEIYEQMLGEDLAREGSVAEQ